MNLQSKFGYCIITKTLNIALCKRDGITDGRTDRRTDKTDNLITRCVPADLSGQRQKKVHVGNEICSQ